jgi:ribosomal 50S subunit-recycling heat shock protein
MHGCSFKVRLDVFLRRTGLLKHRTLAREMCERGSVWVDGRAAKASREVEPGAVIRLESARGILEIEVVGLPQRNYKRRAGEVFYTTRARERDEIF